MSKKNRSRLLAVTALSGVASLIGAGGAQAQQIILDQDGESATVSDSRSGNPAVLITGDNTSLTVNAGGVLTGTGNYQELPPAFATPYTAGQGGVNLLSGAVGGTIRVNAGGRIVGANYGITTPDVVNSNPYAPGSVNIVNHGEIWGNANDGIRMANYGSLVNTGSIVGARLIDEPTGANYLGSLGDGVSSYLNGTFVITDYPADGVHYRIDNSGTIDGRRFGVIISGGGEVTNSGTVHGDMSGVLIQTTNLFGGANILLFPFQRSSLVNTGTITGRFQNGADVRSLAFEDDVFSVDLAALDLENLDYFDTYDASSAYSLLDNSGLIETFATAGAITTGVVVDPVTGQQIPVQGPSEFFGVNMRSPNGYILNREDGVIRATNGANGVRLAALDVVAEIGGVITLDNQGTIIGSIVGSDGQELVRTNGLIDGDVALGLGNDLFYLDADGVVTGTIDLGGGDDVMVWNTRASVGEIVTGGEGNNVLAILLGGTFDATRVFNFQTVHTYGAGNLNGLDLSFVPEIEINDGASLNIGSTGFVGTAFINPGGALVGVGQVDAIVVRSGGSVRPGNSIGTINVVGDVDFAAGTLYEVEVSAAGSDRIIAGGAVTLTGGAVTVLGENGVDVAAGAAPASYVILSGAGGVTGTFSSLTENLRFYAPSLAYTATEVRLLMNPVGADFNAAAQTATQRELGAILYEALLPASGDFLQAMRDSFPGQNAAGVRAGLDRLSGPIHAWAPIAVSEISLQGGRQAARGLADAREGASVWGGAVYSTLEVDASGGAVGADVDTQGALFGINAVINDHVRGGVFGGYVSSEGGDQAGGGVETDGWIGGVQARASFANGFSLGAQVGYVSQTADTSRRIAIGALSRTASASYDIEGWFAALDAALLFGDGAWRYGPFIEASVGGYEADRFTETGANALSLAGGEATYDRAAGRAGFVVIGDFGTVRPRAELGYMAEDDSSRSLARTLTLAGAPTPFTSNGPRLQSNAPFLALGADFSIGANITASLGYEGVFGDNVDGQTATARLAINF